jgi:hypothetical protein
MASEETPVWSKAGPGQKTLTITYKAHTDGSVQAVVADPNVEGLLSSWLYRVRTWPVSGGTAPDAADVTVKDGNGYDLLEANGVDLIHATDPKGCPAYLNGTPALQQVLGSLTVAVANQGTSGAQFCIALDFLG